MVRVLLIDDDAELTSLLAEYLTEEGFEATAAHDGRAGIDEALSGKFDIAVLDIMMPRMNGIEVLKRIRKSSEIPVIMRTARGDNIDRVTGLNLGADDYMAKPCMPDELVARVRAILRRSRHAGIEPTGATKIRAGALTMFPGTRLSEWRGQPLELTGIEFAILEVLARSAGQLVSKRDLSRRAFNRPLSPYDRRIDVHISSIRQKMGVQAGGQSWIRTVRGLGYQLVTDS